MTVRQAQEHDVVPGEDVDLGGLQHLLRDRQQVRVVVTDRGAAIARGDAVDASRVGARGVFRSQSANGARG